MWKQLVMMIAWGTLVVPYSAAAERPKVSAEKAGRKLTMMETMTRTVVRKYVRSKFVVPIVGAGKPAASLAADDGR